MKAVLAELETFPARSRKGSGLRKMADKACFSNALRVAMRDPGRYRYAEGYAWTFLGPVHHAWVVDPDGSAVDVTWTEPGDRYLGLVLDLPAALAAVMSDDRRSAGPAFPELDQIDAVTAVLRDYPRGGVGPPRGSPS